MSGKFDASKIGSIMCNNNENCSFGNLCFYRHGDETQEQTQKRQKKAFNEKKAAENVDGGFQTPQKNKVLEIVPDAPKKENSYERIIKKMMVEIEKLIVENIQLKTENIQLAEMLNAFGAQMSASDMTAAAVEAQKRLEEDEVDDDFAKFMEFE